MHIKNVLVSGSDLVNSPINWLKKNNKFLFGFILFLLFSGQLSAQDSIPPVENSEIQTKDYSSNFVLVTVTDLFFGLVSFGYERTFESGDFGLLIPLSFGIFGLDETPSSYANSPAIASAIPAGAYYFQNKIFSTGLELNYYVSGKGRVRYYIAPALEFGLFHYYLYEGISSDPGAFNVSQFTSSFFTVMIKNGVLFQPSEKINFSTYLGLGPTNFGTKSNSLSYGDYYYSNNLLKYLSIEFGLNLGYRF